MELWQMDVTASLFLADGRDCKVITGIDDHSRFCVIATVVMRATARAVCLAFTTAMSEYGIPGEVLTDIQDGLCWQNAWRCPAGGVRLLLTGARPSPLLTDRSTQLRDFLPVDHGTGGVPPRTARPC
jgi:hypothetical protein